MARVAVVTGAGRGIGAATAIALAEAGWDVAVSYVADAAAAGEVTARVHALGLRSIAIQGDVASEGDVVALFARVDAELGPVTALVNNAGIVAQKGRVDERQAAGMARVFAVNVIGTMLCAREAILRMSTRHGGTGGVIVNVSSAAARLGSPGEYVDYAASKGAVDTFTIGLAKEVADERIRVNAVRPGIIETDVHARAGQPDRVARLASSIPMQRGGDPAEVAHAITWLCSPDASYVTGALLDVAGGR